MVRRHHRRGVPHVSGPGGRVPAGAMRGTVHRLRGPGAARQGARGSRAAAAPARRSSSSIRGACAAMTAPACTISRMSSRSAGGSRPRTRKARRARRARAGPRRHRVDGVHVGVHGPAEGGDDELARTRYGGTGPQHRPRLQRPRLARVLPSAVPRGRADVLDPHPGGDRRGRQLRREPAHGAAGPAGARAADLLRGPPDLGEVPRVDPDQAARGRRSAPRALPAGDALARGHDGDPARTLEPVAARTVVVLVLDHPARIAQLRRPALLPRRDLVRGPDRARDPQVLPCAGRADPRGLWPDRGIRRHHHAAGRRLARGHGGRALSRHRGEARRRRRDPDPRRRGLPRLLQERRGDARSDRRRGVAAHRRRGALGRRRRPGASCASSTARRTS